MSDIIEYHVDLDRLDTDDFGLSHWRVTVTRKVDDVFKTQLCYGTIAVANAIAGILTGSFDDDR